MRPMSLFTLAVFLTLVTPQWARAQKVYRIGALVSSDEFLLAVEGFQKKMTELGYKENKNIKYDLKNAKGDADALQKFAQKLVQDKPDLIVTSSTTATAPVAKATAGTNLPVVFLTAGNPLQFVKSYSSSGNNLTGITTSSIDLTAKRMELLKDLAPGIKKVITLHNPKGQSYGDNLKATREAGKQLRFQLVEINAESKDELIKMSKEFLTRKMGDGIVHPPDAVINSAIRDITPHIISERLPSVAVNKGSVKAGALATYAPDYFTLGEQGALLVHKVLRGATPMDLPIEPPYKLKLVINLKTANAMGLKIPKEVLVRADEVVE